MAWMTRKGMSMKMRSVMRLLSKWQTHIVRKYHEYQADMRRYLPIVDRNRYHQSRLQDSSRRCNSTTTGSRDTNDFRTDAESEVSTGAQTVRKSARQRHRFTNNHGKISINDIPTFHDFQRLMQIRTLYRQYTRLIGLYDHRKNSTGISNVASVLTHEQQLELQKQVRAEFKHYQNSNHKNDVFYIQKSLAEGQRRYKELFAMIYGSAASDSSSSSNVTVASSPPMSPPTNPSTAHSSKPPPATEGYWPWNRDVDVVETIQQSSPLDSPLPLKFPPKSNL